MKIFATSSGAMYCRDKFNSRVYLVVNLNIYLISWSIEFKSRLISSLSPLPEDSSSSPVSSFSNKVMRKANRPAL